jgi:hypothetical protein
MKTFLSLCFLFVGCTSSATAPVVLDASGPGPNLVQLRAADGSEQITGMPRGAFTCEASLVRADDSATCVDVVLRGDAERAANVALEVDGRSSAWQSIHFNECRVDGPCLPPDAHLARYSTDTAPIVSPAAARLCFERVPVAKSALVLRVKQGIMERRFGFQIASR